MHPQVDAADADTTGATPVPEGEENVESEKKHTVAAQALRVLKDVLAAGEGAVGKGD